MKRLLLASCIAALAAAGPLAARTPAPTPAPQTPGVTPTPGIPGPGTGTPGPTFPPIERGSAPADPTAPRPPLGAESNRSASDRLPPIDLERRR